MPQQNINLTLTCQNRPGIVAAVASYIFEAGGDIQEAQQFDDKDSGRFFMRVSFSCDESVDLEGLRFGFKPIVERFQLSWELRSTAKLKRVLIMASKLDHCLVDLLYRWRAGELPCDIPCVISNHEDLRGDVEIHRVPFHCVPVSPDDKAGAFERLTRLLEDNEVDTIVLARYMQILPPDLCARYPGRIINIHHSFLPSFIGAKPYHRAFERGVKLIGATSHYVTEDLDEGPIIEQDVVRVEHNDTVDDLIRYGRDVERAVLARALRYHLEDRVMLNGSRTVVFR
jgi:formyltetrahydrofolate deformylase